MNEKLKSSSNGDIFTTSSLVVTANALLSLTVPSHWAQAVGPSSPPSLTWSLQEWMTDLALRQVFIDKVLNVGMEKMPTYWLGSFYRPQTLLSIFKQVKNTCNGQFTQSDFQSHVCFQMVATLSNIA